MRFTIPVAVLVQATLVASCSAPVSKDPSAVLLSDIADTSCESASAASGRPALMETHCRILNSELEAEFYTAFRSEAACHGLRLVRLETAKKTVPEYYLDVWVWSGSDGSAQPEWQWTMNGAKFSGKAASSKQAAHDICRLVKGTGGVVPD